MHNKLASVKDQFSLDKKKDARETSVERKNWSFLSFFL